MKNKKVKKIEIEGDWALITTLLPYLGIFSKNVNFERNFAITENEKVVYSSLEAY